MLNESEAVVREVAWFCHRKCFVPKNEKTRGFPVTPAARIYG